MGRARSIACGDECCRAVRVWPASGWTKTGRRAVCTRAEPDHAREHVAADAAAAGAARRRGRLRLRRPDRPVQTGGDVQTLSRAVTQGATSMLIKALQDAGDGSWFTVIEREQLDNLLKERQIITEMRRTIWARRASIRRRCRRCCSRASCWRAASSATTPIRSRAAPARAISASAATSNTSRTPSRSICARSAPRPARCWCRPAQDDRLVRHSGRRLQIRRLSTRSWRPRPASRRTSPSSSPCSRRSRRPSTP